MIIFPVTGILPDIQKHADCLVGCQVIESKLVLEYLKISLSKRPLPRHNRQKLRIINHFRTLNSRQFHVE